MKQESILKAFRKYIIIKLHFNDESFIWTKSQQFSRVDIDALNRRKDYHYFDRFAYQFKEENEQEQFLISAFYRKADTWIGEVFDSEIKDFHRRRMIRLGSITHTFNSEVDNIVDFMVENKHSVKDLFLTKSGAPSIIKNRKSIIGGVSDETLAILDKALNFTGHRNTEDPWWNNQAFLISKYKHCLDVDKQLIRRNIDKLVSI